MGFRKDVRDMLTADGKISSKRVVTLVAFILVAAAFIANIGWSVVMDANVLTGMINVVFAGLGVTVGEHLLRRRDGGHGGYDGYDGGHGGESPYGIDDMDDDMGAGYPHDHYGDYNNPHGRDSGPEVNVHVHTDLGDN
jgi:hypothetical protein